MIPEIFLMTVCVFLVGYMVWRDKLRERQAHIERQEAAQRMDKITGRALESVERVTKTTGHDFLAMHQGILDERAAHEQAVADTRMNMHERALQLEAETTLDDTEDLYIGGRKPDYSKESAAEQHTDEVGEELEE